MEDVIVACSIRTALMAAGIAVTLKLLRIHTASARHLAWTALLIVMLLLPIWSFWGPKLSVPILPSRGNSVETTSYPTQDITPNLPHVQVTKVIRPAQPGLVITTVRSPARSLVLKLILLICYIAGVSVMAIRLIVGTIQARSLKRSAIADDEILVSSHCAVPVTLGLLRPVVILPQNWRSWPEAKLDAVLIHESEHVRRCDPLIKWLAQINRAIFWFHPLAWWLERKLATLAEDACDAAVIASGHRPQDYSQYLLDLARDLKRTGARISLVGASIGGGVLSRRIHRILESQPRTSLSRPRALGASLICLSMLAICAACKFERKSALAPNQPSMNELMHRKAEVNQDFEKRRQALIDEVKRMTPEQAVALEAEVKTLPEVPEKSTQTNRIPQDMEKRLKIVRYYQLKNDYPKLDALTLWHIENRPAVPWSWNIDPASNSFGYAEGKKLWLAHLKKPNIEIDVYLHAAALLEGGDKPLAEEVLTAGQKAHFNDSRSKRLKSAMSMHYAQSLLGASGPIAEFNVVRSVNMADAHGPYAQRILTKLNSTTDPDLLSETAMWLTNWGGRFLYSQPNTIDFDVLALAASFIDKALSIEPNHQHALSMKLRLVALSDSLRLRNKSIDKLNNSDRMKLLRIQLESSPKKDEVEAKAKQLLQLAEANNSDPEYGNAIYCANLSLGDLELRRGNKRQAARYLLAAAEATPTERLRHSAIDMTLARQLVDWGEREAVAKFLDKCAKFNSRGKDLSEWATQIRMGINPDLIPYHTF
jgi:beta-lactamase regulating signal transducer with metallopeptidase domain